MTVFHYRDTVICNSGLGEGRRCRQEVGLRMAGVYEKEKVFSEA